MCVQIVLLLAWKSPASEEDRVPGCLDEPKVPSMNSMRLTTSPVQDDSSAHEEVLKLRTRTRPRSFSPTILGTTYSQIWIMPYIEGPKMDMDGK